MTNCRQYNWKRVKANSSHLQRSQQRFQVEVKDQDRGASRKSLGNLLILEGNSRKLEDSLSNFALLGLREREFSGNRIPPLYFKRTLTPDTLTKRHLYR